MNRVPAAALLVGVCLVAAILAAEGVARAADRNIVIVQKGRAFRPAEVTIARGQTVTFTNEDSYLHQIYAAGLFDSEEKAPGENLNETFTQTGTFLVRCHIHPTMRMTVHVR
jgi:plastocyanin